MGNSTIRLRRKINRAREKARKEEKIKKVAPKKVAPKKSVTPKSSSEEVVPKPKPARKKRTKKTAE
mgnify:CR=1 FL=1